MFTNFSYELKMLLNESKNEMKKLKHDYIGTEHFMLSILKYKNGIKTILNQYGYDLSVRAEALPLDVFVQISNNL